MASYEELEELELSDEELVFDGFGFGLALFPDTFAFALRLFCAAPGFPRCTGVALTFAWAAEFGFGLPLGVFGFPLGALTPSSAELPAPSSRTGRTIALASARAFGNMCPNHLRTFERSSAT